MLDQVIYFTAPWCGPCKVFGPRIENFTKSKGIRLVRVDADEQPELTDEFGVRGLPTTIWFNNGEVVDFKTGPLTESQMEDLWLN